MSKAITSIVFLFASVLLSAQAQAQISEEPGGRFSTGISWASLSFDGDLDRELTRYGWRHPLMGIGGRVDVELGYRPVFPLEIGVAANVAYHELDAETRTREDSLVIGRVNVGAYVMPTLVLDAEKLRTQVGLLLAVGPSFGFFALRGEVEQGYGPQFQAALHLAFGQGRFGGAINLGVSYALLYDIGPLELDGGALSAHAQPRFEVYW